MSSQFSPVSIHGKRPAETPEPRDEYGEEESSAQSPSPENLTHATTKSADDTRLAAHTHIVQYDNFEELLNRVEGNGFHSATVHVQTLSKTDFLSVLDSIQLNRPHWIINSYNAKAELLIFEVPSATNNCLVDTLGAIFWRRFNQNATHPNYELDDLSHRLMYGLDGDSSVGEPGFAIRPRVRMDGRHIYNPNDPAFNVETHEEIDVLVEVDEEGNVIREIKEETLNVSNSSSNVTAAAPAGPSVNATVSVSSATNPGVQDRKGKAVATEALAFGPTASGDADVQMISADVPVQKSAVESQNDSAQGESTAAEPMRMAKEDKQNVKKIKILKPLTEEEQIKRRIERQERAKKSVMFPSVVIHSSFAQSLLMLRNTTCWWSKASDGATRIGILAKIMQSVTAPDYGNLIIEQYRFRRDIKPEKIHTVTINTKRGGCPIKKKKATELAEPTDDEAMTGYIDKREPVVICPSLFNVEGAPLVIRATDIFQADPSAPECPDLDVVFTEQDLQEYAVMVWKTAVLEDSGLDIENIDLKTVSFIP